MSPWRRRAARRLRPDANLTTCRSCACEYAIPTAWKQHDEDSWWIHVRCGECGASREIVVSDAAAQRYDAELDRGMHEIARAVHRLERAEMAKQARSLATALELDLVSADDFAR